MKTKFFALNITRLIALTMLAAAVPHASAQGDVTAWTSVEGTTIWARLAGWDGSRVLLEVRDRHYWVPMSRLAPTSVTKARRLLKLPQEEPKAVIAAARAIPATATPKPGRPGSAAPTPRPPAADIDTGPTTHLPAAPDPGLPELPEMPEWDSLPMTPGEDQTPSVLPDLEPSPEPEPAPSPIRVPQLAGWRLIVPADTPNVILSAVAAGNRLQNKRYKWGGGRARLEDSGYDCSGSVSYILIHAGLLRSPITSGGFTRYGVAGPGRWITIYARHGHVFMTVCGVRLDTGGHAGNGPRWCANYRHPGGFVMRHPPGF